MDSVDVQELIASLPEIKVTPPEALPSDESSKSELQGSKNPFPMRARFWRSDLGSVTAHFPDEKEDIQKLNNAWFDTYPWLALKFYANIEHSLDSLVAEELSDEAENPPVSDSTEPEATPEEQESNSQQNNSGTPKDAMMAAVTEYIEARHARKEHTLRRTNMFRYGFSFPIVRDYLRLLEDLAPKALFAISNTIPRQVAGRYSEQVEDIIHAIDLIESGDLPKMCLPSPEDVARLSTDELATLKAIRSEDPEGSLARRACERFAIGRKRNLEHHQRRMGVSAFMAAIRTRVARRGISQNFLLPVVNDYRTTTLVDLILRLHSLYSYKDFPADNTKEETPDLKELRGYQIAKSRALVALQEYTAALNFDAKTHDNDLTEEIHEEQHDVTGIILSFYSVITNEIVRGPSRDGETSKEGDTGDSSAKPRRPLTAKAIFDITKDYLLRIQNRSPGSTTAGQEQVDFAWALGVIEDALTETQREDLDSFFQYLEKNGCFAAITHFLSLRKEHGWEHPWDFRLARLQQDMCALVVKNPPVSDALKPRTYDDLELQILEHIALCLQYPDGFPAIEDEPYFHPDLSHYNI